MKEVKFNGYGNLELFGRFWDTDHPQALLLIVHGFGEHSGRYADMAKHFQECGIAVFSYDYRGHGRSPGKRGHIMSWEELREDLKSAVAEASRLYPVIPLFLLGHSVGGVITLDYLLSTDQAPRGAVVSSPGLGTPGVSSVLLALARGISKILPGMSFKAGLDLNALSRRPEVAAAYSSDSLTHGLGTARFSAELSNVQKRIFERASDLNCPLLLTCGSCDTIISPAAVERFFSASGGVDKSFQIFEGGYHELHNDLCRDEVYRLYSDWVLKRL